MRIVVTMADKLSTRDLRARTALALGRLAHALVRITLAAVLFGLPAYLLWRWLAG